MRWLTYSLMLLTASFSATAADPHFRIQEIATDLTIGYGVKLVDVNSDSKTDIVVVDADRVIWYENPGWQMHTILQGQTKRDNVCLAAQDIDGDGKLDFALGADWRPADTRSSGSLHWLKQGANATEPFTLHNIATEPTIHRIAWADFDGDKHEELIVVPLFGRGSTGPNFAETGVRLLNFKPPANPASETWTLDVINDELHVCHNFLPTDLNTDGKLDLVVASFEGVTLLHRGDDNKWTSRRIGAGNQQTSPNRGASEIKRGKLAASNDYLATIEPWHGFQVVVYTRPAPDASDPLWPRQVLDEDLQWGHAVWCANLDDDEEEELIIGVRDNKSETVRFGLRVYDPLDATGTKWQRHVIDPGGVAIEDLSAADLNADGKTDIVAVGRATKNVRIYWNESNTKVGSRK